MDTTPHTPFIIAGRGLAAVIIANELIAQGTAPSDILLCAPPHDPIASHVPGALMHPLPGSSLKPKPDVMLAYDTSLKTLQAWKQTHPEHVLQTSMLRLDRGMKRGKRYIKSYTNTHQEYSPELTHTLTPHDALHQEQPALAKDCTQAVQYGPTFCVALGSLLPILLEDLIQKGVQQEPSKIESIQRDDSQNTWTIHTEQTHTLSTTHLILAVGPTLHQWFPDLPLGVNGGELLLIKNTPDTTLNRMLSAGGHISQMPSCSPHTQVLGSSYLRPHDGQEPHTDEAFYRPDSEAVEQVTQMIGRFFPPALTSPVQEIWRGRRAVYLPDKHPLVGDVPGAQNLYVLGTLGSKGLLWGPFAAKQLVTKIMNPHTHTIPMSCSTKRVEHDAWTCTITQ